MTPRRLLVMPLHVHRKGIAASVADLIASKDAILMSRGSGLYWFAREVVFTMGVNIDGEFVVQIRTVEDLL